MDRRLAFCVLALLLPLTGCGAVAEKVELVRQFSGAVKPGHAYKSFYTSVDSMAPTIRAKGTMLVDESAYESAQPQRGDIIVFMPPVASNAPFFKRIIALPGDRLSIHHGVVAVNGTRWKPFGVGPDYDVAVVGKRILVDGEALDPKVADVPPADHWTAPDRLPRGCYFVIGDNMANSEDSHFWGCTELYHTFSAGPRRGESAKLIGKVVKIVNPP